MGAGISSAADDVSQEAGLGELPESCVAEVMLNLSPLEICRLAKVNRAFGAAATSDFVWESKLPSNYEYLVEKIGSIEKFESKKEIYAQLCRWNIFDDGNKAFWMNKKTGGICLLISYKDLVITGIDDRRYWNHILTDESRFQSVAYLQQIWWVEVGGEVDFIFPPGTYSLYFRLQLGRPCKRLGRRVCNLDHVHGWDAKPVKFQLWTSDGQHSTSECRLDQPGSWNRYHVGDFIVHRSNAPTKVKFSMTQIDCTHTKGGLCVDSVLIFPKGSR